MASLKLKVVSAKIKKNKFKIILVWSRSILIYQTYLEGEQDTVVLSDEIVCWESDIGDSDLEADDDAVSEGLYFLCKAGLDDTTFAVLITAGCCCFPAELTKFPVTLVLG